MTFAASEYPGIQPVLEITLNDATWDGTAALYLSGGVASARGNAYEPRVIQGGWGGVRRYFDIRSSNLARLETSITVADADKKVQTALEDGEQRGSVARIYWVVPGSSTEYSTRFTGILNSWEYRAGRTTLELRTDDAALRTYLPNYALIKAEWPDILDTHIGTMAPLIYGTRDSSGLTSTGFLHAFLVDTVNWRYVVCLGQAKTVKNVYQNGVILASDYSINYGYTNAGKVYTIIYQSGTESWTPAETDVVTVDVDGYETTGNTGGDGVVPTGSLITNPVLQMSHLLINHAEDKWESGAWALTGSLLDADSWAEAAQWADRMGLEGSGYVGGKPEQKQVVDLLNEWLNSYPCFRAYWTTDGTLALATLDLKHPGYRESTDPPLLMNEHEFEDSASYALGVEDITDKITASYLYDDVNGSYTQTMTVIDPDIGEDVSSSLDMPWSIARAV